MIDPDKIEALIQIRREPPSDPVREQRIPYPRADQALYASPNPDGSRKACRNCWKWVTTGNCLEVAGEIEGTQVCGLHVFGTPQPVVPIGAPSLKPSPAEVGLIETPAGEGTCCALCRFFEQENGTQWGLCKALGADQDAMPPVVVEPLACCARWERNPKF